MTCQVSIWAIYLHLRGSHSFLGSWTNQMTFLPKCTFITLAYVSLESTNRVQGNQGAINGYKSVYYRHHVVASIRTALHASWLNANSSHVFIRISFSAIFCETRPLSTKLPIWGISRHAARQLPTDRRRERRGSDCQNWATVKLRLPSHERGMK